MYRDVQTVECPICGKSANAGSLGQFWQKFGYAGPSYCSHCSGQFRNHIVRMRGQRRADVHCSRQRPCAACSNVLSHFPARELARAYKQKCKH